MTSHINQSKDLVLFHATILHSLDVLIITRHLLQLITCIVVSGVQPEPSDGHEDIDDHVSSLSHIMMQAVDGGGSAEVAAACEVVRTRELIRKCWCAHWCL
jgi:hypothetical protein